ncbi:MAG: transcription termination/antitermination protein NusA [Candidatus Lloydbacteria bacterium CG22_combo_CG10-13_8_21_14_all_47_15]|uniref:Transcription termination/antitermination protein NusA n=1 Tax=Candidatus Lloydbacteria bacterium CG22_combo_CG10-13_8_21_14_all_47_15 TaxID=1974635 RepID=A0A2H0CTX7_9BACT|nr:MAG: transcription termination/antitermination protein NusA [Candidatus Lloydbacteria bacterium CG22_combo_CG10-13_8_21_14_all_47_15]
MIDLKTVKTTLEQLETERGISKERLIDAIEQSLAAAYKKEYGKRGQIVRAHFDLGTGQADFLQVRVVVSPDEVRVTEEVPTRETSGASAPAKTTGIRIAPADEETVDEKETDERIRFNPEHHILLEDAQKIKKDAKAGDEIVFPLENKDDYGRIAAQTAKQVIIQRIREAEKESVIGEYGNRKGEIVSGTVQRIERGTIYVDLGRAVAILQYQEQIPGERYRQGEPIRAYLYSAEDTPRGISLRLSRSHPKFIEELFKLEAPEVASGVVVIKSIAREVGSRTKIAVHSEDDHVDPVGACVGPKGVRVSTVMSELHGEKIDIIEWSDDIVQYIAGALSPAQAVSVEVLDDTAGHARVEVAPDQLSLAIGKGGQNVRLAAKLTGWKLDIISTEEDASRNKKTEDTEAVDTNTVVDMASETTEKETGEKEEADVTSETAEETGEKEEVDVASETTEKETGEKKETAKE